jgi:apolipoprotein N-acyltransferase
MLWKKLNKPSLATTLHTLAALCSAFLLISAYPPFGYSESAWAALIPLILIARHSNPRQAWRFGFFAGILFWLISISWLLSLSKTGGPLPLVAIGWFLLSCYCAMYIGLFTMTLSWLWQIIRKYPAYIQGIIIPIIIPIIWVGFEYARSSLFTGFAWNQLGVSQYNNLPVIQLAQWGGVYAVSALVAIVNVAFTFLVMRFANVLLKKKQTRISIEIFIGLTAWLTCLSIGIRAIKNTDTQTRTQQKITITAIQPNIKQLKKWPENFSTAIYQAIKAQTSWAAMALSPNLIVWPETAVPGTIGLTHYTKTKTWIAQLAQLGSPILAGVMEEQKINDDIVLYNSSFLFDTDGTITGKYRKCHLVPFGEYLPLENQIKILKRLAPLGFSCLPGKESTIFTLPGTEPPIKFSSLICFEDTVAPLARRSVRNGARLLINQTNDAWFDGTAGAIQHMTHCIFRCIENRVPAVRCANTGITVFIDNVGRTDILENTEDYASIFKNDRVTVPPTDMPLTFYSRFGDSFFAIPCSIISIILLALTLRRKLSPASPPAETP